jgi:hypothetical protein
MRNQASPRQVADQPRAERPCSSLAVPRNFPGANFKDRWLVVCRASRHAPLGGASLDESQASCRCVGRSRRSAAGGSCSATKRALQRPPLVRRLGYPERLRTTSLGPLWVWKPPWFPGECRILRLARAGGESGFFAALFGAGPEARVLLAMQKVEGSNPFSRFLETAHLQVFFVGAVGWCVYVVPDRNRTRGHSAIHLARRKWLFAGSS